MANKYKFTLSVNTVGCEEPVVTVSADSLAEAALMAQLIFVAACELRLVRGFDDEDKVDLKRLIESVAYEPPGKSQFWRISDTQIIFIHRDEM